MLFSEYLTDLPPIFINLGPFLLHLHTARVTGATDKYLPTSFAVNNFSIKIPHSNDLRYNYCYRYNSTIQKKIYLKSLFTFSIMEYNFIMMNTSICCVMLLNSPSGKTIQLNSVVLFFLENSPPVLGLTIVLSGSSWLLRIKIGCLILALILCLNGSK